MIAPGSAGRHRLDQLRMIAASLVVILAAACADKAPGPAAAPSGSLLPVRADALPQFSPAQFRQLLDQLRGRPLVVNIWASWCGPCIVKAPHLAAAAREFEGRVQYIGVDVLDHRAPARAFIREYRWSYPSVFDPSASIRDDLELVGQPVTLVSTLRATRVHQQRPSDP